MGTFTSAKYSPRAVVIMLVLAIAVTAALTTLFRPRPLTALEAAGPALALDSVVNDLRDELESAELHRLKDGKPALFEVKDVDLELEVVAKSSNKLTGKVEYEVVTAEMEREIGKEATHKVTLHLELAPQAALQGVTTDPTLTSEGAKKLNQ